MPKETFKNGSQVLEVRWPLGNAVQVGVVSKKTHYLKTVEGDAEFNGFFVSFDNEAQIDALIKALQKAKRKTFKKS